ILTLNGRSAARTLSVLKSTSQISCGNRTARSATPWTTTNSSASAPPAFLREDSVKASNSSRVNRQERQLTADHARLRLDFRTDVRPPERGEIFQVQGATLG